MVDTAEKQDSPRTIGLFGATGVGIGAIVGGGILVLAGVAFSVTGPGAVVAFGVNGIIAILTALSFAEMSSSFPESGGAYTFAKKVLNVRAAFAVGWILWFAYIVAGVLYALGFAEYAVASVRTIWESTLGPAPSWLTSRAAVLFLAIGSTGAYVASLVRKATGGGELATWGKVVVFVGLILAGAWVWATSEDQPSARLTPFFTGGSMGLLQAMGFTFIALQGFDLIAAIGGEVKRPSRTIPRAMLLSLGAALVIYIPLLLVASTVGVPAGTSIVELSTKNPETVMAEGVKNFLGPIGYWLVMIAAVLSTLSALQANLLAASRIAESMATDRTLPPVLGKRHETRATPVMAIYASALALVAILLMVPDLAAAGAAASLIFLIVFALAHWTAILARRRSEERVTQLPAASSPHASTAALVEGEDDDKPFRTPLFPVIPIVGGLCCVAMAVFQGVAVPAAGGITLVWLLFGALLYFALFAGRAQTFDALSEARDPQLVRLRGRAPLMLVPVANPESAPVLVGIAAALAPPRIGRVMMLSVMPPPKRATDDEPPVSLVDTSQLVKRALTASYEAGHKPEALMTVATAPWPEISRVARSHHCSGLLLGLPSNVEHISGSDLEQLLDTVDCDVAFFRMPHGWKLENVRRILVPVGGAGAHVELRARLLGSLGRGLGSDTTWLTALKPDANEAKLGERRRALTQLAQDTTGRDPAVEVVRADDPVEPIVERSAEHDLLVLGLQRDKQGRRIFGQFALRVVTGAKCATILISRGT